jgi:hypothetical protein
MGLAGPRKYEINLTSMYFSFLTREQEDQDLQ